MEDWKNDRIHGICLSLSYENVNCDHNNYLPFIKNQDLKERFKNFEEIHRDDLFRAFFDPESKDIFCSCRGTFLLPNKDFSKAVEEGSAAIYQYMNKDPQFSKDNRQIFFELILPKINQYDYNNIYLSSHSAGCVTCLRICDEYYKENKENNLYLILYNPWCQWDKGEYEFTDKGKPNFWKIPLTTSIEWKNLLDSFQGKKTDTIGKHVIWNSKPYNIPKDRIHCKRDKNDYFASVDLNYNDNGRKVKLDVEYLEGEESLKEKLLIYRHFLTNFIEGDFIEYYDEEKLIEKFNIKLKSDEGIKESLNIINEKLETINNICDHMEKNNSYIGDVYISLKRQKRN